MAVGSELETLFFGPSFDAGQPDSDPGPPDVGAVIWVEVVHYPVEGPHAQKVKKLREKLDGEGRVDAAPSKKGHGVG